jgi:hypothetical protein
MDPRPKYYSDECITRRSNLAIIDRTLCHLSYEPQQLVPGAEFEHAANPLCKRGGFDHSHQAGARSWHRTSGLDLRTIALSSTELSAQLLRPPAGLQPASSSLGLSALCIELERQSIVVVQHQKLGAVAGDPIGIHGLEAGRPLHLDDDRNGGAPRIRTASIRPKRSICTITLAVLELWCRRQAMILQPHG